MADSWNKQLLGEDETARQALADPHHPSNYRVNPAFDRYPAEAALVGFLLAAFGEIEYAICRAAGLAIGPFEPTLRALYRLRMTSSRLDAAWTLMQPFYTEKDLDIDCDIARAMALECLAIRNQYAHCNWGDDPSFPNSGLFFTDLEEAAQRSQGFTPAWRHVDVPLLEKQKEYFAYAMEWATFIRYALADARQPAPVQSWPRPRECAQPLRHNPPESHVPPWLSADETVLHLARARAAKGGAPTPTPAQQAQDAARVAKQAKKAADRERSVKGNSPRDDEPPL